MWGVTSVPSGFMARVWAYLRMTKVLTHLRVTAASNINSSPLRSSIAFVTKPTTTLSEYP